MSADYSDIGLNPYLQAGNTWQQEREKNVVSGYNFDAYNDRDIIGPTRLRNFSFSQGSGGTIDLGGTANGNGLLIVRDSSGGTIATIDNNGITVTNGNITIQNSGGTTILDGTGLVSANNFPFGTVASNSTRDFTNSSYTDIGNTTLITSNFPRTTNLLISYSVQCFLKNMGGSDINGADTLLSIDGTDQFNTTYNVGFIDSRIETATTFETNSRTYTLVATGISQVSAGTHTLKLRVAVSGNTLEITDTAVLYVALGS